jgi:lysozyme
MSRLRKGTVASVLAVATVGGFEGYRANAYKDAIGVPTICYGETRNVHLGDHRTKAECDAMLLKRLDAFANHVERCVKRPLSDKTEVAFVSLAYNIGEGAFCGSSVVRLYNAGEARAACDAMMRFNRAGGHVLAGLTNRRKAERKLCLEGL